MQMNFVLFCCPQNDFSFLYCFVARKMTSVPVTCMNRQKDNEYEVFLQNN